MVAQNYGNFFHAFSFSSKLVATHLKYLIELQLQSKPKMLKCYTEIIISPLNLSSLLKLNIPIVYIYRERAEKGN